MSSSPLTLAAAAAGLLALGAASAHAGEVTVTVTGAKGGGGKVLIALQTEGQFAKPAAAAYSAAAEPSSGRAIHSFSNVKPGRYAVAVVQDTDKNGAVTLGKTGPTEPWGLSGAVQTGAPKFAPAAVEVTAAPLTVTVPLTSR